MLVCQAYDQGRILDSVSDRLTKSLRRTFYLSEDFDRSRRKAGCNSVFAPCDLKLTGLHLKPIGTLMCSPESVSGGVNQKHWRQTAYEAFANAAVHLLNLRHAPWLGVAGVPAPSPTVCQCWSHGIAQPRSAPPI